MFDKILLVWLLILSHCQPALAVGSMKFSRIDVQTKNGTSTTNYVKNPSGFKNALDVTTSSASIAQDVTGSSDLIDGIASLVCDASAQNGYCRWDSETIQEGDKTGNCEAKAIFKGDASLYKLEVYDGSSVVASSSVLSNATDWTEVSVNYPCGSTRQAQLTQTESGTGAAVNIGRVYWGRATNLGEVAQAQIYGTLTYAGAASCTWSRSGAIGNFSADTDCATPTVTGYASAPATKIPGITFASLPPGKYKVHFDDTQFYCQSSADCYFRITDGTTNTMYKVMNASNAQRMHMLEEVFIYTSAQSNITFQVQAYTGDGNTADIYAHGTGFDFKAVVTYFPSDSQIAVRENQTPWYVDATMDGGNPSLGVAAVSSYTEMTDAGLTLKPQSGSAAVGVMCSSTNAATSPSTSNTTCAAGSESVGINFSIPKAGAYEVCFYGSVDHVVDSTEFLASTFQLIETPTNAQTLTLEGGTRLPVATYWNVAGGVDLQATHNITNCSVFNWSSNGIKGVRLMYEQVVSGTPDTSTLQMDANASYGQKNGRWTVKPVTASSPMPLLTGSVTSNSSGLLRTEIATIAPISGASCTIANESGDWLGTASPTAAGDCTIPIQSGIFSATPVCTCGPLDTGDYSCQFQSKSSSSLRVNARSAGVLANVSVDVHCTGPR